MTRSGLQNHDATSLAPNEADNSARLHRNLAAAASATVLVALNLSTHTYKGLSGDAELYAFQAIARMHPWLAKDVFLQFGSQDTYTVFSPLYSWFINWLGLRNALVFLILFSKVYFFSASWALARAISNARLAYMGVALLIVVDGGYGGYSVFRYAEDYLTARSLAEALSISAILLHLRGSWRSSLTIAVAALLVHPLMALPVLLLLLGLGCSYRVNLVATLSTLLLALGASLWATHVPSVTEYLPLMDPAWLEIVRERSVFLFPHLWNVDDWLTNSRPLLSFAVAATVLHAARLRALCITAGLLGAFGVAIAFIAGIFGHIAILIQAQTWRWMWVATFLGVLVTIPTAAKVSRIARYGPFAAILIVSGWIFKPTYGIPCMCLGLIFCLTEERRNSEAAGRVRLATIFFGVVTVAWAVLDCC